MRLGPAEVLSDLIIDFLYGTVSVFFLWSQIICLVSVIKCGGFVSSFICGFCLFVF